MSYGQVEAFLEIAKRGTMREAAERLSLSQPALTARLQGLERDLGSTLFRRTRGGMVLTAVGRAYLPYAQRALESLDAGASLIREMASGVSGELSLGVAPAVSAYVLPELLARFGAERPDIRLLVKTGHSEEIADLVVLGEADIGITRRLRDPRIRSHPLYEDQLVFVTPTDHAFAERGGVELAEIRHEQLILFDRTSSYYDVSSAFFRDAGVTPRGVTEVDNVEAAKRMVERGLGVALLPVIAVADSIEGGRLRRVELVGAPALRREMVAIERLGQRATSPHLEAFWRLLYRVPELVPGARRITGDD